LDGDAHPSDDRLSAEDLWVGGNAVEESRWRHLGTSERHYTAVPGLGICDLTNAAHRKWARADLRSIEAEVGLEIPELVARTALEVDAAQRIMPQEQIPVPEHSDDQVHWRVVQIHDLNGEVGSLGQIRLEIEDLPDALERLGRVLSVEDSHIDIAAWTGGP